MKQALGLIRVSSTAGREGDRFASPETQRDSIQQACEREGLNLVRTYEELDVSGGKPLSQRPGLREAVAAVEAGDAQVVVAAYFDRLFRSLSTQAEVVERINRAGGEVLAVDVGRISNGTASQWLSATMLGMVAEHYRRITSERVGEAQVRAVARGVVPYPGASPGYIRTDEGKFIKDPVLAPIVADAFELRADGGTIAEVREYLSDGGITLSFAGVARFLQSRVVLGQIHFGDLHNLDAHEPIVDRAVWQAVQRVHIPRGRKNKKSDRLLARLGVLKCGSCGAKLIAGLANQTFPTYRCPYTSDCTRRVTISANLVESAVVETVQAIMDAVEADYTILDKAEAKRHKAQLQLDQAQANYEAFMAADLDFTNPATTRKAQDLEAQIDAAQIVVDQLPGQRPSVDYTSDWNDLSLDDQRAQIQALIKQVVVWPGRGADRIELTTTLD